VCVGGGGYRGQQGGLWRRGWSPLGGGTVDANVCVCGGVQLCFLVLGKDLSRAPVGADVGNNTHHSQQAPSLLATAA